MPTTLTNKEVSTLFGGLRSMSYKAVDQKPGQKGQQPQYMPRDLPLIPATRVKRMIKDLEPCFETLQEGEDSLKEKASEKRKELKQKVDDGRSNYTSEQMVEDYENFLGGLEEEADELMKQTVEVGFSDPLNSQDIRRIDESNNDFPSVVAEAVLIIEDKEL